MGSPFSPIVLDHFQHPRRGGCLVDATHEGWAGNVTGSRFMRIQLHVYEHVIHDARFATYGCAPAIAAGSYLCDQVVGPSVAVALTYTADQLNEALGGLPEARRFCADLAVDALHQALAREAA